MSSGEGALVPLAFWLPEHYNQFHFIAIATHPTRQASFLEVLPLCRLFLATPIEVRAETQPRQV
jgi:hypothetical protein